MESYQAKVRKITKDYKALFPEEYINVVEAIKTMRLTKFNESTGAIKGDHVIGRHLIEFPETLFNLIYNNLTEDEFKIFDDPVGQRWFAKTYPEFRLPTKL